MTTVRRLVDSDIVAAQELADTTFAELSRSLDGTPEPWTDERAAWFRTRVAQFVVSDGPGQWVAEDTEGLAGVALSSVREGLWGLSLLVVRPGLQGAGLGRTLIDRALAYGADCPAGVICASDDPKALRRYAAAGFALSPSYEAKGDVDLGAFRADSRVQVVAPDPEFGAQVDRAVRGSSREGDYALLTPPDGGTWWRYDDGAERGYAAAGPWGNLGTLAATDAAVAQALLWAYLAHENDNDRKADVSWVTAAQQWAIPVLMGARLTFTLSGTMCWRGRAEPVPYLPHGALL